MVNHPKDWEKVKLSALVKNITTGKLDANHMVRNGKYRFYTCAKNYYYINNYAFDGEALLISGNGEYVGYVHYYEGKFNAYQRTYVLMDFSCNSIFLKYYLDYFLESQINSEMKDGNTPYIVKSTLEDFLVTIPPLPEQKSIAETLMTLDRHIENLESLIEKKKMIRDGALEDLMTGKTRLDGLEDKWEDVKLSDLTEILTGLTYSPGDVKKNGVLVLRSSNIQNDKLVFNDNVYVDESKIYSSRVKVGDIIMCVRNGSSSLIGKTAIVREKIDATFGAFMSNLRCYDFISKGFIYYFFKTSKFREEVDKILGATINQITKSDLNKLVLTVPTDKKEQEAIASILTSMDEEIENLEKEKAKIEKIKDGAMDDLLTGRVRLI